MPKQATHVGVVRQWCQSLGVLSAVSISRQEAEMKLAAYVPMLMERFPDAAFTTKSLEHVARHAMKGFPTYAELALWLHEWWRDNGPVRLALAPPEPIRQRDEPTEAEKAHVTRIVAELVRDLRSDTQPDADRRPLRAVHLTPEQLDIVNPLPGGLKRVREFAQ